MDLLAKGLAIEARPFAEPARRLGMSEEEIIRRLRRLMVEGKVRRFAASVRHQPLGYAYNAMIIARTDDKHLEEVARAAARLSAVSHCYQRAHPDGDPFCVYIMVHARDQQSAQETISAIRNLHGVRDLEICPSLRELKKTSLSGISSEVTQSK